MDEISWELLPFDFNPVDIHGKRVEWRELFSSVSLSSSEWLCSTAPLSRPWRYRSLSGECDD